MQATMGLAAAVTEQLARQWHLLRESLTHLADGEYRRGEGYLVPARLLLHTIETCDFYLRDERGDFRFGARFGADWEGTATADLPSREQLLTYLAEVEALAGEWLRDQDEASLLGPTGFAWTGPNRLGQMMYLMRHTHCHLGELNALLRIWGVPRVEWR